MEKFSFDEMYKMQKSLQEKYLDKWGGLYPEKGKDQLLWMIGEIGEVIDIIKKNGGDNICNNTALENQFIEAMVDVLMYYSDVLLCFDISPEKLKQAYIEKYNKNMNRW